jgi:uncharacterized membrane protein
LEISTDLKMVIIFLILAAAFIFVPGLNDTLLRPLFSFALVLFVPGYVAISAFYPGKSDIGGIERAVLSFAASICVVPLLGFALNFTSWGVTLEPVAAATILFTIVFVLIAYKRRLDLPAGERFSIDFKGALREARAYLLPTGESTNNRALTLLLLATLAITIGTAVYIVAMPNNGDHFTEFYLLGPNGTASNYTTKYYLGDQKPITIGIVNHELRDVDYDLIVHLDNGTNSTNLYQEHLTLADNQTLEKPIMIQPDQAGSGMKLVFDLYADGNMTAPYRQTYLWINVIKIGDKYTDFKVLNTDGTPASPGLDLTLGSGKNYTISILNNEYHDMEFFLAITLNDGRNRTTLDTELFTAPADEVWQQTINVIPDRTGDRMTLEFRLYDNSNRTLPYKESYITANVTAPAQ